MNIANITIRKKILLVIGFFSCLFLCFLINLFFVWFISLMLIFFLFSYQLSLGVSKKTEKPIKPRKPGKK
jgi:uncharacterized membrane protein